MADGSFEVSYQSWAALRRDREQQIERGGLLLRTETVLERFSPLTLRLIAPSGASFELEGQVLQVLPGHGIAVQLGPGASEQVEALRAACAAAPADDSALPSGDPAVSAPGSKGASMTGPSLSLEPQELRRQLEAMTVNEKRQAALRGRREVRLLLIKDLNKGVHPFVLKNPAITLDEVEQIAKMPSVNPDALRIIAGNREWVRSPAVCRALVRNPKTPLKEALLLLEKLPMAEVRALAKSSAVRGPIQQAARKKAVE